MKVVQSQTYDILIGEDSLQNINLSKYSAAAILVDENTKMHCLDIFLSKTQVDSPLIIEILSGETNKNISTCQFIWEKLITAQFDRNSIIINLGGGVIGDMGGFAASCYKRGIDYIQVPTTLLAMVDASVGGKLGVDFMGLKNQIGLFKEPKGVYIFPEFLKSLEERQLLSGYAEVIKHALISDLDSWNFLSNTTLDQLNWESVIGDSVTLKNKIVSADPQEKGWRKTLNFGHSLGHAIESYYLSKDIDILHGEAIAIGMHLECLISTISSNEKKSITHFLNQTFRTIDLPHFDELLPYLENDKKNEEGKLLFSLLSRIGECQYNCEVSIETLRDIF